MTTVLILSSSYPYPVDAGRKVVMSGFIDYLSARFGADNITFATLDVNIDKSLSPVQVIELSRDRGLARILHTFWTSGIKSQQPIQEAILYSSAANEQIKLLVDVLKPDLLLVDTVRMAGYVEDYALTLRHSVLYLDDLYSLRYEIMLQVMRDHPNAELDALGAFGRFLPPVLTKLAQSRAAQRTLMQIERRLLQRREIDMVGRFHTSLLLNASETALLRQRTGSEHVITINPYLMPKHGRKPRAFTGEPTFLFLGLLSLPANAYSLDAFLDVLVKSSRWSGRILVVGRDASPELRAKGAQVAGVQFLDYVPDLRDVMSSCAAMVVPILFGTGLKTKILDALYHGLPIISTPCGIDGISLKNGENVLVAELHEFLPAMTVILDPKVNAQLSANAIRFYEDHFSRDEVFSQYDAVFTHSGWK